MTKQVNHFIREWRKYRGFSVRTLAEHAGLAPSTIGGLETGNASYSQASLEAIAKALQTTPATLLSMPPSRLEQIANSEITTGISMRPSMALELLIDGQQRAAAASLRSDLDKAVTKATNEMFKRLTKQLKSAGWTDSKEGSKASAAE